MNHMNHLSMAIAVPALLALAPAFAQQHADHGAHGAATVPEASKPAGQRPGGNREWTRQPLLAPAMNRSGDRSAAVLRPMGIDAAEVLVMAADGPAERRRVAYPVGPEGARIEAAAPKIGNYHWAFARSESETGVRVASTTWYFPNPGKAPTDLLKEAKHELEIVPEPLPREHSGYRESEKWRFLVRMNGVPVASQPLTLETEFGSRSTVLTDAAGRATVVFPRDFKPAQGAGDDGHGPRRAKFVLSTEKEEGGRRYLTAFNYVYGQDADRNRSLAWGAVFGALGMVAATPLLRRRSNSNGGEGAHNA